MARRLLLVCGILASVAYVIADLLSALRYPGIHSFTFQSISELSAIGAPTRSIVVPLLTAHSVLALAFGVGVWRSAGEDHRLRRAGRLLIALGIVDVIVAPFFPVHVRGADARVADTMHILVTIVTVALILLAIWFASNSFGTRFRAYSIATIVSLIVCGALAGLDGPKIAAHEPTPWLGVTERINIGGYCCGWRCWPCLSCDSLVVSVVARCGPRSPCSSFCLRGASPNCAPRGSTRLRIRSIQDDDRCRDNRCMSNRRVHFRLPATTFVS